MSPAPHRAWRVLALAAALGLLCAWRVDVLFRLRILPPAGPAAHSDPIAHAPPRPASLAWRWVDAGGVGIPADGRRWGRDYSHNTQAFHDLIRLEPPYVDEAAFRRVSEDWQRYLERMAAYGNNGVVVGVFLELVDFDRLEDGRAVYPADSPYRARHRVLRQRFAELFAAARQRGFRVLLKTDMLALTEPLERHLRAETGGLDAARPELWSAYRAAFQELFSALPDLDGVVIRVGEAGPLFNRPGWPYWSRFQVSDPASLRTMLRELLPAFEERDKLLVLRTWSVGPGPLGSLHADPATYRAVLGDIDSPSLVVSTKYLQGDFFSFLPPNPTLWCGSQRRVVEFQARREFEGFGAFPNYMAAEHQQALQLILARNPRVAGTWLWTQDGGPLRAGPLSLYPLHGFWHWIDANVYATSRLAADPQANVAALTREWVAREVAADPAVVDVVSRILLRSREAVERGFYVRPFAEQRLRIGQVEVPPLLWIMEWDRVGGWSAALSTMYRLIGPDTAAAVADGFAAAEMARDARLALEGIEGRLAHRPDLYRELRESLLYEESLLEALAWYRRTFLSLYSWLHRGDAAAGGDWRRSEEHYRAARLRHQARYQGDLDFPAFDFGPADDALATAGRTPALAWLARGWLVLLALLHLPGRPRRRGPRWTAALLLATGALTAAALFSLASWRLAGLAVIPLAAFATGLWLGWGRAALAAIPAALSTLLLPAAVLLAAMSVRGPLHLWFLFWTAPAFRAALVTLLVALHVWAAYAVLATGRAVTARSRAAWGGLLAGAGLALLVTGALLPRTEEMLGALHSPLGLLPLTFAVVLGIVTYLDVPAALGAYAAAGGLVLLVIGLALARRGRVTPSTRRPGAMGACGSPS